MRLIRHKQLEAMRFAIYIRKSREDRASYEPRLKKQRTELPEYARELGAKSITIYDDGHSSASKKNLANLPERNRMIEDIKAGKIDVVLVIEISRLSRDDSMTDMSAFLELCSQNNVLLATLERIMDPSNTSDWHLLMAEGTISAVEMKNTLERMGQGMSYSYLEGKFTGGGVPKPYVYDKSTRKPVVDPIALRECQQLWDLAETHSAHAIANKLGMTHISVRRALSDKRLDYLQAIRRNPESGEIIRCEWTPVMTSDQAARIRAARRNRATNGNNTNPNSLLSGLGILKCGHCGNTVKTWCNGKPRKDGTKLKYYGCSVMNIRNACPTSRSIPQVVLDEGILTNVFNKISCLEDLMHHWVVSQGGDDFDKQMKALELEERSIKQKMERMLDEFFDQDIPGDLIDKKKKQLSSALADIQNEQQSLKSRQTSAPDWDSLLLTRDEFNHLDFIDRRRFLSLILDEITVHATFVYLHYKFPVFSDGGRKSRVNLPAPRRGTAWGRSPRYKGA